MIREFWVWRFSDSWALVFLVLKDFGSRVRVWMLRSRSFGISMWA